MLLAVESERANAGDERSQPVGSALGPDRPLKVSHIWCFSVSLIPQSCGEAGLIEGEATTVSQSKPALGQTIQNLLWCHYGHRELI